MTSYTLDELIRIALIEVRLQNQYFSPKTPEQETRLNDARRQYTDAREEVLLKTPAAWMKTSLVLPKDVSLPTGWYRLPADCINLVDSTQIINIDKLDDGCTIYQLKDPGIEYYAARPEEDRDPLFQAAVRYRFLSKLCMSEDSASIYQATILSKEKIAYSEWLSSINVKRDSFKRKRTNVISGYRFAGWGTNKIV